VHRRDELFAVLDLGGVGGREDNQEKNEKFESFHVRLYEQPASRVSTHRSLGHEVVDHYARDATGRLGSIGHDEFFATATFVSAFCPATP
jgi:EAL domain-containing protein (putative c-di-GMP-specific phosphodiesterase class I)